MDLLSLAKTKHKGLEEQKNTIFGEVKKLDPKKVEEYVEKYDSLVKKQKDLESENTNLNLKLERDNARAAALESEVGSLREKEGEYYENKEAIENKENLVNDLKTAGTEIDAQDLLLKDCEKELLNLYKDHGSLEQKLSSLEDQKRELSDLREDYAAYDLFMQCMHTNGISYDIIKKKLPVINNEIAKVLANVVDFEIFFENDSKHLKMHIKHPKHEPRPLEMGSGAEKTIAAMAIRLALLSVSSLPKSDIFILDEPGSALDADNMDGFISILDLVKSYFKTVLLISHLDSLKDCVDTQITIDKQNGYAFVQEV